MAAHSDTTAVSGGHDHGHDHATPGMYAKIGLVLFVLTALEVALYEVTYGKNAGPMGQNLEPFFVPILLILSAAKFALVAMYYMHLKGDSKLFTSVFVFPLIIATIVIISVMVLMAYHTAFAKAG